MKLVSHVFCSEFRVEGGVLELVDPLPGIRVSASAQEQIRKVDFGSGPRLANVTRKLALYMGLVDGYEGRHRLEFSMSVTVAPGLAPPPPGSMKVGNHDFRWPKGEGFYACAVSFGQISIYLAEEPIVEKDGLRSPIEYTLRVRADGRPLADLPIPVVYDSR